MSASALYSRPQLSSEWWYYHGHLHGEGRDYGFHVAFFRLRADGMTIGRLFPMRLVTTNVWFAHFAIADIHERQFHYGQRRMMDLRGGAASDRYDVRFGDWRATGDVLQHTVQAQFGDVACRLEFTSTKPPICHYDRSSDANSHWSFTRMRTAGTLTLGGRSRPVVGESWMDRECGRELFAGPDAGWNWLGIQLDDGRELMVYDLRDTTGARSGAARACLIDVDGSLTNFAANEYELTPREHWTSPRTSCTYPAAWQLTIPGREIELVVQPYLRDNELDSYASTSLIYWEGPAAVDGHGAGRPLAGRGFIELVGYDRNRRDPRRYDFATRNWSFLGWAGSEICQRTKRNGIVNRE